MTTARKFRQADQRLYIIKKTHSISTRPDHYGHHGAVVGILKVGAKHLYIYDEQGQVHERTPLCVLDFYVHESQQRLGYGKRLFDTMLDVNSLRLSVSKQHHDDSFFVSVRKMFST